MSRSCGSVQNFFRQVDLYPTFRRNQALLQGVTVAATRQGAAGARVSPRVPVIAHVLYKDDADNISDAQVASQIEVLNEDFSGRNTDLEKVPEPFKEFVGTLGLEFFLADVDPFGAATNGITRRQTGVQAFSVDDSMKADASGGTSPWDTARYLNIWVCRLNHQVLGYAQFPGGPSETDGVVIATSAFGRGGTARAPYGLGRTATHEIGHYLNLSHIWGEQRIASCIDSDFVDDTPNQWGSNIGKPAFPSLSCGNGPNGDMFMNYMDYVDDDTMFMFTKQQVERMQAALEFSRPDLGNVADTPPAPPVIVA
jgi:hypothetical protein